MFIPRTLAELDNRPGRGPLIRAVAIAGIVAVALTVVLSAVVVPSGVNLAVGQVAPEDIRAPVSRTFESEIQTQQAREDAAAAIERQYVAVAPRAEIREEQLRLYDRDVARITRILESRDADGLTVEETIAALQEAVPSLVVADAQVLAQLTVGGWEAVAAAGRSVLDATLAGDVREDELPAVLTQVREQITTDLPAGERSVAGNLAAEHVTPNLEVSLAATEAAKEAARNAVDPVMEVVQAGETIVRGGDQITELDLEILRELGLTQPTLAATTILGNALVSIVVASILVGFLWRFQPDVWHRNRSLFLFLVALIVSALAIRIAGDRAVWTFVVPTSATVLLVGILLGVSSGAAMAATLAVIAGVVNRDALEPAAYVLAGGSVALLTIVRAERLNTFVRTGALLAVTNVLVVTAFSLLDQRDAAAIVQLSVAGIVNAGLSVLLAVGSFAMLGNVLGIMTVFQLLELANPSNRLLRRLLLETPGTYHHSVMVGNLAERAAETIGADPLLARVGAYYHDIGKMKNPLAFIENQAGAHNIHDELNAETSARIIAGHIRDGIDLAYEYGLPVRIIGFIPQHHGTSVMSYFYGKALDEVGGNERLVNRNTFRYPGPKPQSREAAILMLGDGVEASVRSLDDKDEASIRGMVDRIVDSRVEDGQLDDAELTLKNIVQIKDAFVGQLLGMYHTRIKYPDNVVPIEQRREA